MKLIVDESYDGLTLFSIHGFRYRFFSDNSFSDLFWSDSDQEDNKKELLKSTNDRKDLTIDTNNSTANYISSTSQPQFDSLLSPHSCSSTNFLKESPPDHKHLTYTDPIIINNFPPLEYQIVNDVKFPGLNALEFFEVFFADNAPYSFKEFQTTSGDIDLDYGKWKRKNYVNNNVNQYSFHPNLPESAHTRHTPIKFPTSSRKERVLNFKTLTKSYFGPAYATAQKTQRVSKFSTRLVIIENKTELFDIPFCDRFFVIERWVIEADKNYSLPIISPSSSNNYDNNNHATYEARLSVSVEVFMLKPCKFERQIRQKTLSTVSEILESWSKKATQALELAIQKKLERNGFGRHDDGISMQSYRSDPVVIVKHKAITEVSDNIKDQQLPKQEQTLKKHKEKLKQHKANMKVIEEKISTGDLEWCNIEIRQGTCGNGDKLSATCTQNLNGSVVEDDNWADRPIEISIPMTSSPSNKSHKKGVRRLFKNRK